MAFRDRRRSALPTMDPESQRIIAQGARNHARFEEELAQMVCVCRAISVPFVVAVAIPAQK